MRNFPWIIILILVGIIIWQRSCVDPETEFIIRTDTIIEPGDSIVVETQLPAPDPDTVILIPDTIIQLQAVDTAAILADYFLQRIYRDTLKDDSSAFIRHDLTIYQNRITDSKLHFQNRRAKTVIKQTISPGESHRAKVFAGLSVGRSPEEFGAALNLALLTKRDHLYAAQYDFLNKDIYFTMYWKIKLKR